MRKHEIKATFDGAHFVGRGLEFVREEPEIGEILMNRPCVVYLDFSIVRPSEHFEETSGDHLPVLHRDPSFLPLEHAAALIKALTGIFWADAGQIIGISTQKRWAEPDQPEATEMLVTYFV